METTVMRRFYWSLRRELWENRSLTVAPVALATLFMIGATITVGRVPETLRRAAALDPMKQHNALATHYDLSSGLMMGVALIVTVFYCLDALYGERRDRSILFWKSLPVSDRMTVVTKAAVAVVFVPLLCIALTLIMDLGARRGGGCRFPARAWWWRRAGRASPFCGRDCRPERCRCSWSITG